LLVAASLVAPSAGTGCSSRSSGKTVRVAAASDLTRAFGEIGQAFQAKTGIEPIIDFTSSGALAKQIEQGVPYTLFASASKSFVDQVVVAGRCDASTIYQYSRGRLVVWTRGPAPHQLSELTDPKYRRIAIANPDHAPYGKAAVEALQSAGLYDQLKDKIVPAESVQVAFTYAQKGSVDAALVAMSLAVADTSGGYLAIDPSLHKPLDQALVVCGKGEETAAARQLAAFIASSEGREILMRYGFSLTGEVAAPTPAQGSARSSDASPATGSAS
jgi:molybdate transport system substrate-binding protein